MSWSQLVGEWCRKNGRLWRLDGPAELLSWDRLIKSVDGAAMNLPCLRVLSEKQWDESGGEYRGREEDSRRDDVARAAVLTPVMLQLLALVCDLERDMRAMNNEPSDSLKSIAAGAQTVLVSVLGNRPGPTMAEKVLMNKSKVGGRADATQEKTQG